MQHKKGEWFLNEVYLDKDGKLFVNGNEIKDVESVESKTTFTGTRLIVEFRGDFKSDFSNEKTHSLGECANE